MSATTNERATKGQLRPCEVAALTNFNNLPDDAYVRVRVVAALRACHVGSVWRDVQRGILPPPVKLSHGITAWRVGDLRRHHRAA